MADKLKCCIFCTTPFQIITAIQIVKNCNHTFDILLFDQFPNCDSIAESIRKTQLFNYVYVIDCSRIKRIKHYPNIIRKVYMLYYYFFPEVAIKELKQIIDTCACLYSATYTFFYSLFSKLYLIKKAKNVKFIGYDDGIGSYLYNNATQPSRMQKKLISLLYGEKPENTISNLFLYSPELYMGSMNNKHIKNIPTICKSKIEIEYFNKIFNFKQEVYIQQKYIIFDTVRTEVLTKSEIEINTIYFNLIKDIVGDEELIIKTHPRNSNDYNPNIKKLAINNVPSELWFMNCEMKNKVLISLFSTASLTPKLLFNEEPVLIFIYNLFPGFEKKNLPYINYLRKFCREYSDQSKCFFPKTSDELKYILKNLS